MKALITLLTLSFILGLGLQHAEAKPKKKEKKAKVVKTKDVAASKQTTAGIEKLMGVFKWSMTSRQVMEQLEKEIHAEMDPALQKVAMDPLAHDQLRKEMMSKIDELKKSLVRFAGKKTPWEVSIVDKEFAHNNNESMVVSWGKKDRRFFFFHDDKLWKLYIAFNSDLYSGKTFEDFAQAMEGRFGKAERKFTSGIRGDAKMDHLAWPPSEKTMMRAIDNTGFYGSFCLVLTDRQELKTVNAGRKINSPKRDYGDPLVDAVTKESGSATDEENDIVDRVTGKNTKTPSVSDGDAPPPAKGASPRVPSAPAKKPKKVDTKNPLDGLDL
jgi:hypothetical protein